MPEVFSVKAIKPKKLNLQVYRNAVREVLQAEARAVLAEYKKTTKTWRHRVAFETMIDVSAKDASVFVGTDDEIYGYVDKGTRPHMIRPRKARMLRFKSGYRAKTSPGKIGSTFGGPRGDVVYARAVKHPGTKARKFSETIQKRRRKKFTRAMVKAMQRAAKKSF